MFKKKAKEDESTMTEERAESTEAVIEESGSETLKPCCNSLTEQLQLALGEIEVNRDLYLRSRADLDNFRKRAQREKEDLLKFANETILRELLPVIDNLERALQHAAQDGDAGLLQGVEMTLSQFSKVLEKFNVVVIDPVGETFDSARHEAMGQIESVEHPANTIVQILQKGYLLNERLLRPALVLIAKAPTASPAA